MANLEEAADPAKGERRPDPDPTVLTTQALFREIAQLRELFNTRTGAVADSIDQSLENSANARHGIRELLEEKITGVSRLAAAEIAHLREVDDIRFQAAERLAGRESELNALALAAAFAAQKEASAKEADYTRIASVKSETSVADAIDKLGVLFATQTSGLGDKVDDLKDRVGRIESVKVGATENRNGLYAAIGVIATGLGIVGFAIGILAARPLPL